VFEGLGDSLRDSSRDLQLALRAIEGDLEVESIEDLALDLRRCFPEAFSEVREALKLLQ
jgi:hypothetical protein